MSLPFSSDVILMGRLALDGGLLAVSPVGLAGLASALCLVAALAGASAWLAPPPGGRRSGRPDDRR